MPSDLIKPIIFISYAHADEPEKPRDEEIQWLSFVMKFLLLAVKVGEFRIWVDPQIPAGRPGNPQIERHLQACKRLLSCSSPRPIRWLPTTLSTRSSQSLASAKRRARCRSIRCSSKRRREQDLPESATLMCVLRGSNPSRAIRCGPQPAHVMSPPRDRRHGDGDGRKGCASRARDKKRRPAHPGDRGDRRSDKRRAGRRRACDARRVEAACAGRSGHRRPAGNRLRAARRPRRRAEPPRRCVERRQDQHHLAHRRGRSGKSALVNEWLSHLQADGYRGADCVLGWSFFSQGSKERATSADEFLNWALGKLGVKVEFDQRFRQGRGHRRGAQQAAYVILDGVEPLQHGPGPQAGQLKDQGLRALLRRFAAAPPAENHSLIVLTSRIAVADIKRFGNDAAPVVDVERLSDEAGADQRDNDVWASKRSCAQPRAISVAIRSRSRCSRVS